MISTNGWQSITPNTIKIKKRERTEPEGTKTEQRTKEQEVNKNVEG